MTNYQTGHAAEVRAADYLKQQGFKIRELNWKTPVAEIDVVAEKAGCLYFIEVKYRQTDRQGTGLDYITATKLKHMQRAAELWLLENKWDKEVCLAVASLDGQDNFEFVELS